MSKENYTYTQEDVERAFDWYMRGFTAGKESNLPEEVTTVDCCCKQDEEPDKKIEVVQAEGIADLRFEIEQLEERIDSIEDENIDEYTIIDMASAAAQEFLDCEVDDRITTYTDDLFNELSNKIENVESNLRYHTHDCPPEEGETGTPKWPVGSQWGIK